MSRRFTPSLSFWQVTISGIGIVIGAGIYVLIGPATASAGHGVWMSFLVAGLLSALTGLSYAELAGMFPSAGAEYSFARHATNEFGGFLVGWLMIAANLIAAAAVAIGFGHYARHFIDVDTRLAAVALLFVLTLIIATGIRRSIWLTTVLVVLQVGGLALIIIAGTPHIGSTSLTQDVTVAGVLSGAALIFFAFIGFDEIVTLSEETKDAARTIPRALLLALGVSTALYVCVAIAAMSVVGAEALAESDTPLTTVLAHDWGGSAGDMIAVIALASTTNTTLLVLTAATRLMYGMARQGSLPGQLSLVARETEGPWVAALAGSCVALGFVMIGDIKLVASVTDFAVYAIFIAVNGSLIILRFRRPDAPRNFATPLAIGRVPVLPVLGIATIGLVIGRLEVAAWFIGGGALLAGLAAWLLLRATGMATAEK